MEKINLKFQPWFAMLILYTYLKIQTHFKEVMSMVFRVLCLDCTFLGIITFTVALKTRNLFGVIFETPEKISDASVLVWVLAGQI